MQLGGLDKSEEAGLCINHPTMLPRIGHVARVLRPPGESPSGCKCSFRDLGGAVLTSVGMPLVCRNTCSSSMRTAMQLACAKGAQMLLQRQVQVPSLGAECLDASPGPNMQECIAVQVLLHGPSS